MPQFPAYMHDLATRRSLRRSADGSSVTYRFKIGGSASLTVVTNELDPTADSLVMSEAWPVPVGESAHLEFMREALRFNRSALHHLNCGVVLDPTGGNQYRLAWRVPDIDAAADHWNQQLQLFGKLTDKAWEVLPRPGARAGRRPSEDDAHHMIFMP